MPLCVRAEPTKQVAIWRSVSNQTLWPHTLLERVRDGTITLISTSPALLGELAEVIERPQFASVLARSNTSREHSLAEVQALAEVTAPAPLPTTVCRDPDDDEVALVLALARATQVDLIVSRDKERLPLNTFESIPIVTPADALRRIEAPAQRGSNSTPCTQADNTGASGVRHPSPGTRGHAGAFKGGLATTIGF